ncbi:tumor necrosis factor receptor superfamily member wengen isoform X2 [Drosophila innubila]|uniref:tumor necrosis factor receptor superfamily member wengen isoform X2 n=1 Tax=Drosophila innubila TaxID=198719 RepID=UPI00148CFB2B|nr:tumor necrosis factor receptor superfamily member wengen isoform X2 [Drosophila innubila]
MQPLTQSAAATATRTTTTKHTTSSCKTNNNNLTLAIMHRSTRTTTARKTSANSKFHKRRRRRQRSWQRSSRTTIATATATTTTATTRRYSYPNLSRTGAYLTLLLLTTTCSLCASVSVFDSGSETSAVISSSSASAAATAAASVGAFAVASSPCAPQHWWNQLQGKCTPCTSCQGEMISLRPCQLHIDTVCGSIYDLKIDWVVLAQTERNWKERRKSSEYEHIDQATALQHLTHEQLQQLHEEAAAALPLDWQTGALFIAVLACLLFFSVAACILIHHMRQWRRMERRLDQDVEELSTKLMAKLAEVQSLDGGTFFIGNADALRGLPASAVTAASAAASAAQSGIFQPQHVLLPVEKHVKHQERRILKTLQPGNVYIEENNAVGVGIIPNFKG